MKGWIVSVVFLILVGCAGGGGVSGGSTGGGSGGGTTGGSTGGGGGSSSPWMGSYSGSYVTLNDQGRQVGAGSMSGSVSSSGAVAFVLVTDPNNVHWAVNGSISPSGWVTGTANGHTIVWSNSSMDGSVYSVHIRYENNWGGKYDVHMSGVRT